MNFSHNPIHEAAKVTAVKLEAFNREVHIHGDYKRAKVCTAITRAIQAHVHHLDLHPNLKDEYKFCKDMRGNMYNMEVTLKAFKIDTTELSALYEMWVQATEYAKRRKQINNDVNSIQTIKTLFNENV